jgi:hypothetical protein
MGKKIDFDKIVETLNIELQEKYRQIGREHNFPEFEYDNLCNYFTLGKDSYGSELIYFTTTVVYSKMRNGNGDPLEKDVIDEVKAVFNEYLVVIGNLKF